MVRILSSKEKKRKDREATEAWMNTPITFPGVILDDASDEPLIIEAKVEGYLVRRVYMDEGSSVEVMFEHCFENLPAKVWGKDRMLLHRLSTSMIGSVHSKGIATLVTGQATIIAGADFERKANTDGEEETRKSMRQDSQMKGQTLLRKY
ncbi:hypothetical protein Tco_1191927 [Tanacetum coccineum]